MGKGICYKMSKEMYDSIKYPMFWNGKEKKMKRSKQGLSKKEILEYVNKNFGLIGTVTEINFV